jgi:SHS2 domain-containing protein
LSVEKQKSGWRARVIFDVWRSRKIP